MQVQSLGYVGVGASDLADWTDFATNWLGMQMVERGNASRAFRMDDRQQRIIVDRSLADGDRYFGFEVADASALDALAARLEAAEVPVRRAGSAGAVLQTGQRIGTAIGIAAVGSMFFNRLAFHHGSWDLAFRDSLWVTIAFVAFALIAATADVVAPHPEPAEAPVASGR